VSLAAPIVERRKNARGQVRRAAPVDQLKQGVQVPPQVCRDGGRELRVDSHLGKVRAAPPKEVLPSVQPAAPEGAHTVFAALDGDVVPPDP